MNRPLHTVKCYYITPFNTVKWYYTTTFNTVRWYYITAFNTWGHTILQHYTLSTQSSLRLLGKFYYYPAIFEWITKIYSSLVFLTFNFEDKSKQAGIELWKAQGKFQFICFGRFSWFALLGLVYYIWFGASEVVFIFEVFFIFEVIFIY